MRPHIDGLTILPKDNTATADIRRDDLRSLGKQILLPEIVGRLIASDVVELGAIFVDHRIGERARSTGQTYGAGIEISEVGLEGLILCGLRLLSLCLATLSGLLRWLSIVLLLCYLLELLA